MTIRQTALVLALLAAPAASAQTCPSGLTPVQDVIHAPVGTGLFAGVVTVAIKTPIGVAGRTYGQFPVSVQVSGGTFSACIAPNDAALPQKTTYAVRYDYRGTYSASWTETWYVSTSAAPVTIAQVRAVVMSGAGVSPASWSVLPAFGWFNLSPYSWSRIVP